MLELKNDLVQSTDTARIFLSGEVDTESLNQLQKDIELAKAAGSKTITFIINSPGGSVSDGLAMYDLVSALSGEIETIAEIQGVCASAATYLPLACDRIRIHANSDMMLHEPQGGFYGTLAGASADLEYFASLRDRIIALYCSRTGLTPEEIENILGEAKFLSAKRCKELNLVDEIIGESETEEKTETEEKAEDEPKEEPKEEHEEEEKPKNSVIMTLKNLLALLKQNNVSFVQSAQDEFAEHEEIVNSLTEQVKNLQSELEATKKSYAELEVRVEREKEDYETRVENEVANRIAYMGYRDELPQPAKVKAMSDTEFANALRETYRRAGYAAAETMVAERERGEI